jgi:hypothetical protein
MSFSLGDEVIVHRARGDLPGSWCYRSGGFFYGDRCNDLVLGTKARIVQIRSFECIFISYREHSGEIQTRWVHSEEIRRAPKNEQGHECAHIDDLLCDESVEQRVSLHSDTAQFEPTFNAREEFALWVRQHYPQKNHTLIMEHQREILDAATKACVHADQETKSCVRDQFLYLYRDMKDCTYSTGGFCSALYEFVNYIELVSHNLRGELHYGTSLKPEDIV